MTSLMSTRKTTVNWTDSETELLLTTIKHYKYNSIALGYDWTGLRERYDKIRDNFISSYQQLPHGCDGFPNKDNLVIFSKTIVVNKIKRLRSGFREIIQSKGKYLRHYPRFIKLNLARTFHNMGR